MDWQEAVYLSGKERAVREPPYYIVYRNKDGSGLVKDRNRQIISFAPPLTMLEGYSDWVPEE